MLATFLSPILPPTLSSIFSALVFPPVSVVVSFVVLSLAVLALPILRPVRFVVAFLAVPRRVPLCVLPTFPISAIFASLPVALLVRFIRELMQEVAVLALALLTLEKLAAVLGGAEVCPERVPIDGKSIYSLYCDRCLLWFLECQVRAIDRDALLAIVRL